MEEAPNWKRRPFVSEHTTKIDPFPLESETKQATTSPTKGGGNKKIHYYYYTS